MELVRLGLLKMSDFEKEFGGAKSGGKDVVAPNTCSRSDSGGSGGSSGSDGVDTKRTTLSHVDLPFKNIDDQGRALLRSDVRILLQNQLLSGNKLTTPRVLTRIMHGLGSPAFPSPDFWNTTFWNRHRNYRFDELLKFVTSELVSIRFQGKNRGTKK